LVGAEGREHLLQRPRRQSRAGIGYRDEVAFYRRRRLVVVLGGLGQQLHYDGRDDIR
jgi:hypothetical protein